MPQSGKYNPSDVVTSGGKYGAADVAPPAPSAPGFGETFWEQLVGTRHPLTNIGETLGMAVKQPRKLLSGLVEFQMQAPVSMVAAAKPLLKAAAYMTPPGMAYAAATRGRGLPKLEDVTALGGGKAYARAGELAGAGRYREAAGAAAAGVVQTGAWFLGGLLKPTQSTIAKLKAVEKGVVLSSGERLPITPGMQNPTGIGGSVEKIAGQLIGGERLRAVRVTEAADAEQVMKGIAERTAAQARVAPAGLPQGVSASFRVVSDSVRTAASPLYEQVIEGMRQPGAVQPLIQNVAATADKLLSDVQLSKVLVKAGDARPAIEESLKRVAAFKHGVPPESIALAFDGASVWEFFQAAKSGLLSIKRIPSITRAEHRIISKVVGDLDSAMDSALAATDKVHGLSGETSLQAAFRRGAALTKQGYALEEVAAAIESATKGTPTEVQAGVKGLATRPEQINASQLVQSLRDLAEPAYPGGKSTLRVALPRLADEAALRQVADYLLRSEQLGGESVAAKFGILAAISAVGGFGVGAITGFYMGRPIAGMAAGLTPEIGAWIISRALTSKAGPRIVADLLTAAPRSAAEAQAAKQLAGLGQQNNGRAKDENE